MIFMRKFYRNRRRNTEHRETGISPIDAVDSDAQSSLKLGSVVPGRRTVLTKRRLGGVVNESE